MISFQETGSTEYTALKVVSYIGCAISIACLIVTVVFFLIQGYDCIVQPL